MEKDGNEKTELKLQKKYTLSMNLVRDVGVLQERVHAEHGVVRLDARRGDLRARPDGERDLRLLAVVDRQALEEQAAETRACAATARVEHHEALETRAVVSELAEAVQHQIHDLLANPIFQEPLVADVFILNSRTTYLFVLSNNDVLDVVC